MKLQFFGHQNMKRDISCTLYAEVDMTVYNQIILQRNYRQEREEKEVSCQ